MSLEKPVSYEAPINYPERALGMALRYCSDCLNMDFDKSDLYIVWFAKTLSNWKALVSTDATKGLYLEVTHDGFYGITYIDQYVKGQQLILKEGETNND